MRKESPQCSMEAASHLARPNQRRRPPEFGSTIPSMSRRGMATKFSDTSIPAIDVNDREDCPLCKKFSSGPCGELFKKWLACTDVNPGKDDNGEPLHLTRCSSFAERLAECLDENSPYYSKDSEDEVEHDVNIGNKGTNSAEGDGMLKDAWTEFVSGIEDGIKSGKYSLLPFPATITPRVEVRISTHTGAAFFVPENDAQPIIAAYILDDSSNVIAAASQKDMYMNGLGCVIQFKVMEGMKSATCRAIYDMEGDNVSIVYTRTMLVPG